MSDTPITDADLELPETLQETKDAISALIGDITELQALVKMQYEGRREGQFLDWRGLKANQERIAALQGDVAALKKHAAGFREAEALLMMQAKAEKQRLKAQNIERSAQTQREAMAAKNDRRVASAESQARRETAAQKAIMDYAAEHFPDHVTAMRAIVDAVRKATP